ncbi:MULTISPECIES: cytochrome b [unclassified Rhodanobacter]|uniref:Cytochrome b n=1 Tax=Rhodanobacter humi TaxID=1888173 RepID=A0ABV4AQ59_9GAMM
MMQTSSTVAARAAAIRYDRTTIVLHWLTALLVLVLFALAMLWDFLPRATRTQMHSLHISLGIVLAAVLLLRLAWRATRGRRLPMAAEGVQGKAATAMHYLLYLLLAVQVILGFAWRWAQAETFQFFGLFPLRFATVRNGPLAHTFGDLHDIVGWTIVILAGLHATVALVHHYVLKDGVLRRMTGDSGT